MNYYQTEMLHNKSDDILPSLNTAFTIVELLVVIVVIAILAAITVVAYVGIGRKATEATLQSDLTNSANRLKMYQVEYGRYPTMGEPDSNGTLCPTDPEPDTKYCIKPTPGNTFTYNSDSPYSTFTLDATNTASDTTYNITNNTGPILGSSEPAEPSIPTVTIGSQTWMQYNLNEGTRLDGGVAQTDNSTVEKYCYDNDPNNCTTYGGLYQWDEAMQYTTTEGAQGICPTGFHVPTDAEFKTLEIYLGMSSSVIDRVGIYRGTNQGDQLKGLGLCQGRSPCATSGFDGALGGSYSDGLFEDINTLGYFWTSRPYPNHPDAAFGRYLGLADDGVYRGGFYKVAAISIRCVQGE